MISPDSWLYGCMVVWLGLQKQIVYNLFSLVMTGPVRHPPVPVSLLSD